MGDAYTDKKYCIFPTNSPMIDNLQISMESISSMFSDAGTDYHKHPVSGEMQVL